LLHIAKELVKRLPYPVFLRAYDLWQTQVLQQREERCRQRACVPLLDEFDIKATKTSDTVFLLGSGPSINSISNVRWEAIRRHDTWGYNFWPYHWYVPRLYFFEAIQRESYPHTFKAYVKLTHEHGKRYEEVPKIVTELQNVPGNGILSAVAPEWKRKLYAIVSTDVAARTPEEFVTAMRYLKSKGVFDPAWPWGRAFKYASTLSMLVGLAARLEYKRIVLCGIDLRTQEYFYQDADLYPDYAALTPEPTHLRHMSFRDFEWLVKVDLVISVLSDIVLWPKGISIFVENRSSALWPGVPELDAEFYAADCAAGEVTTEVQSDERPPNPAPRHQSAEPRQEDPLGRLAERTEE
jgi:hypothetical protein